MKFSKYEVCKRCVMDTSAGDIKFDDSGYCNYCATFMYQISIEKQFSSDDRQFRLKTLVDKVRRQGDGKEYDCIVGVSGGIDSSWALLKAVELGLRPLAVHMDNGWDSELAQNNIANLVGMLEVDLYTYVIEWEEYRSLMEAFLAADVIDVELLYDNAMLAVNYQQARKYRLKSILSGSNQATEGMRIPSSWNWNKRDSKNIKGIAKVMRNVQIMSFPAISNIQYYSDRLIKRIEWIPLLDYLDYGRASAVQELEQKVNFRAYPYKHYESIFTRFYQGYLLPVKFGVDKRRLHLATLVISGELSRDEALADLEKNSYPDLRELESDRRYFLKKMKWSEEMLESYLSRPPRDHADFPTDRNLVRMIHTTKSMFFKS